MPERAQNTLHLKVLAFALALLCWFFVTWERNAEKSFSVPVLYVNLAPGASISAEAPRLVEVRVAGPRLLLLNLDLAKKPITLDVGGITSGTASFPNLDKMLSLRSELKITRMVPSRIDVLLTRDMKGGSGT